MAGDIFWKERSIVTLTSTGTSLATATAVSVGTDLDARALGNVAEDEVAIFEIICQWATVTGIVAGTVVGDLYLVPKIDGTNPSQVDTTSGASYIPPNLKFGSFVAAKAPTAATNTYFHTAPGLIMPVLYTPYLLNNSGQTISANWTMKVVSARRQYS